MLYPSVTTLVCFVLTVVFVMAMAEPGTPKSERLESSPPKEGAARLVPRVTPPRSRGSAVPRPRSFDRSDAKPSAPPRPRGFERSEAPPSTAPLPLPAPVSAGLTAPLPVPQSLAPSAPAPSVIPPAAPSNRPSTPAMIPPPAPSSRSKTPARSFSPPPGSVAAAGGSSTSYERAFRQWSAPSIASVGDEPAGDAVTFQVYTPEDISTGRGPTRSRSPVAAAPTTAGLGLRIAMAVGGGLVVLLTAAAVIAVSIDEPKRPASSAIAPKAEIAPLSASAPPPAGEPAAMPSTISIGDPLDEDVPIPSTIPPPAAPAAAPAPTPAVVRANPKATPSAPSGLKTVEPPPNPYGNE